MDRNKVIAMIHVGQKRAGWDDTTYRAWLHKHTGHSSCKECNEDQLSLVADLMRDMDFLDPPTPIPGTGGTGPDRPTQKQWRFLIKLAKECGLSGSVEDPAIATMCAKVAKIDNPRFLDQRGMHALINAMEGWARSKQKKRQVAKN